LERRGPGAEPPFVGRREELQALAELARRNAFTSLVITGGDGVGKSRLVAEFVARSPELIGEGEVVAVWFDGSPAPPAVLSRNERLAEAVALALKSAVELFLVAKNLQNTAQLVSMLVDKLAAVVRDFIASRLPRSELYVIFGCDCLDNVRAAEAVETFWNGYNAAKNIRAEHVMYITSASWKKVAAMYSQSEVDEPRFMARAIGPLSRAEAAELYWHLRAMYPKAPYSEHEVWRIAGGNPQAMVDAMMGALDSKREFRARVLSRELLSAAKKRPSVIEELRAIARNPDAVEKYDALYGLLVYKTGMVVPTDRELYLVPARVPEPDPERGIGSRYMWRAPFDRDIADSVANSLKPRGPAVGI